MRGIRVRSRRVSEGACARHAEMRAAARRLTQRIGRQIESEFRAKFFDGCWSAGWSPFDALPAERVLRDARDEMLDGYAYIHQAREQVRKAVAALDDAYQETVSCTGLRPHRQGAEGADRRRAAADPKPPPEPPPGPSPDRMGKDRDMVSQPDATGHPGDCTTDRADRDYGDEGPDRQPVVGNDGGRDEQAVSAAAAEDPDPADDGPDDDSPAADARFRELAAEPDTDVLNRLARLEETVRGLEAGNRMLEATVASMRAQNDRLARRVDRIDGRL